MVRFSSGFPVRALDDILFYCGWYTSRRWAALSKRQLLGSDSDECSICRVSVERSGMTARLAGPPVEWCAL